MFALYFSLDFFQEDFVRVRKQDLDKLSTEVMQLREFLPRVMNRGLVEKLQKARTAQTSTLLVKHHLSQLTCVNNNYSYN